ncbi:uncharacterized protein LOC128922366 [Zeugodacus cucurbitae]|uniref:uncharacterized protein LOC128922366 n=1 Tax=Zeugodacus cucurbitae TaxID=28588 RepID=UPI0023D96B5E|nr:uncharacterized protein LOC128922366 [Zeugodacus cucurbitae]
MASYHSKRSHIGWITKLCLTFILVVVLRQHGAKGIPSFNQVVDCGPQNVYPESCMHGSFELNFNTEFCLPRTLCYTGEGEICRRYGKISDCKPGLYCNCDQRCGKNLIICSSQRFSGWNMRNRIMELDNRF